MCTGSGSSISSSDPPPLESSGLSPAASAISGCSVACVARSGRLKSPIKLTRTPSPRFASALRLFFPVFDLGSFFGGGLAGTGKELKSAGGDRLGLTGISVNVGSSERKSSFEASRGPKSSIRNRGRSARYNKVWNQALQRGTSLESCVSIEMMVGRDLCNKVSQLTLQRNRVRKI